MSDILALVSEYYAGRREGNPATAVMVSSADAAAGRTWRQPRAATAWALLGTAAGNAVDSLKARVRGRSPVRSHVRTIRAPFPGTIAVNFRHGTAVVIGENIVDKFYFKDRAFFGALSRHLRDTNGWDVSEEDTCVVMRQPRYRPRELAPDDALRAALPALQQYQMTDWPEALVPMLSVRYKAMQLLGYYSAADSSAAAAYVALGAELDSLVQPHERVLCHGDLWSPNILWKEGSGAVLIDFDKTLCFLPSYDLVYFYMMRSVPSRAILSDDFYGHIGRYVDACGDYLASLGVSVSMRDLHASLTLFALLKHLERDLRHGTLGRSLPSLHGLLTTLIPRGRCG